MNSALPLSSTDLALVALLLCLNAGISLAWRLGLERRLAVAAVRSCVQLLLLGFVLERVFSLQRAWIVLLVMLAMALLAGFEAVRRTSWRLPGLYAAATLAMLASSMFVTLYGLVLVIGAQPWWTPRYAIPVLGMVLGNTLNGISVGLESVLSAFDQRRGEIELLLATGAERVEACRPMVRDAVRTGMIPILNSMTVVGLVAIPGMMTGQILGGEDPATAARYQLFILFLIAGGVALGTVGVVLAAARLVFDERQRLRLDRLRAS